MTNDGAEEGLARVASAECYRTAADLIYQCQKVLKDQADVVELPAAQLVSYSLELFLKAYLLLKDKPVKTVEGYGHKLLKLVQESRVLGLEGLPDLEKLAELLATGHSGAYIYRYPKRGDTVHTPNWSQVRPIIMGLMDALVPLIGDAKWLLDRDSRDNYHPVAESPLLRR